MMPPPPVFAVAAYPEPSAARVSGLLFVPSREHVDGKKEHRTQ
jgi:hypothetical protein